MIKYKNTRQLKKVCRTIIKWEKTLHLIIRFTRQ